jgi:hypothetical protein
MLTYADVCIRKAYSIRQHTSGYRWQRFVLNKFQGDIIRMMLRCMRAVEQPHRRMLTYADVC